MIGYELTDDQYTQVQGKFYATYEFFNCVQDINNVWYLFLSDQDKEQIIITDWKWLLGLPQSEYIPKTPIE